MIRRLQFLIVAVVLLVAAFSTGLGFLFYVVYLGLLAVGGSYVLTRFGLADLEAGAVLAVLSRQGELLWVRAAEGSAGWLPVADVATRTGLSRAAVRRAPGRPSLRRP